MKLASLSLVVVASVVAKHTQADGNAGNLRLSAKKISHTSIGLETRASQFMGEYEFAPQGCCPCEGPLSEPQAWECLRKTPNDCAGGIMVKQKLNIKCAEADYVHFRIDGYLNDHRYGAYPFDHLLIELKNGQFKEEFTSIRKFKSKEAFDKAACTINSSLTDIVHSTIKLDEGSTDRLIITDLEGAEAGQYYVMTFNDQVKRDLAKLEGWEFERGDSSGNKPETSTEAVTSLPSTSTHSRKPRITTTTARTSTQKISHCRSGPTTTATSTHTQPDISSSRIVTQTEKTCETFTEKTCPSLPGVNESSSTTTAAPSTESVSTGHENSSSTSCRRRTRLVRAPVGNTSN